MTKPGPQQTPLAILEKRGSWLAKSRQKAAQQERDAPTNAVDRSEVPELTDEQIETECRTLIPGYDAWVTALPGQWFELAMARMAIEFFHNELCHVKGVKYRKAFVLEPWQRAIIGNLFGWLQDAEYGGDPVRRYRETFILVPRKNGKSPMSAGIINYLLFRDGEHGAEIYGAASTHQQASLVFEHARGMVLNNDDLRQSCKIFSGQAKSIQRLDDFSTYRVVSSDAFAAHGWNTHGAVADELHTWANRDLLDAMVTSTAGRRQPLIVEITTADFDRESICNEKHDYAISVRDNEGDESKPGFDPHFLPVLYETLPDEDWTDEAIWRKANPNLGVSVSMEYLRKECKRAQETPTYENTFKRLHLNIRTEQDVRWITMDAWDKCSTAIDERALAGRSCYAALDLSTKLDITAFVMVFPPDKTDKMYRIVPRFWIPKENAEARQRRDRVPYSTWIAQGKIFATDGNVVDYEFIKAQVMKDAKIFKIHQIGYDPWNATQIALQLQQNGAAVVEFGQGFKSMSEPTKELEKLVIEKKIAHGGDPIMRWMASNMSIEIDPAANVKPSKKKSTDRIDGIVTTIMALGLAMLQPNKPSIYDAGGLRRI